MKNSILKFAAWALGGFVCLALVAAGLLYVRLLQGPVSAGFLNAPIEQAISKQFPDVQAKLGEAQFTLKGASGLPIVSFRNVVLNDAKGNLVASAPEAAISLSLSDLLIGRIRAKSLDLVGPSISARRNSDGSLVLGFNAPEESSSTTAAQPNDQLPPPVTEQASGAALLNLLDSHDDTNSISSLNDIRVSNAVLHFYDDGNAATWFAPQIDLSFEKKPYGFVVLGSGDIASTDKPWHAELSATYRHDDARFDVSATLDNVIPASAARKVYALSQFAALTTPLSGHADLTIDAAGRLVAATGEFRAAKGQVKLPEYFADPIAIDEGLVRVSYVPQTESFVIANSTMVVGARPVAVSGSVTPERNPDGTLSALAIKLETSATPSASDTNQTSPDLIDHISFSGHAAIDKARLDIDDLVVLSGNNGLRMRGSVAGGERSPAIHLAGRLRDVNTKLLQVLWPPIIAPRSRTWIFDNVVAGNIPEGSFQINYEENQLAEANDNKRNPDGSIDFQFMLSDVTTHYFRSLPDLVGASGQAHLLDNTFKLDIDKGAATLASGDTIKLNSGSFIANDIHQTELIGQFHLDLEAPISAMITVAENPDLKMLNTDTLSTMPKATGTGHFKIDLEMPLVKDPPKDRVVVKTAVELSDVAIAGIAPGVDLTDGKFKLDFNQENITVSGPAKINGQPGQISWSKPRDSNAATARVVATLDDKSREKLGLQLKDYLIGPVEVDATVTKTQSGNATFDVKADLSKATLQLKTLSWLRPPTPGTLATFKVVSSDEGRSVQDFKLDGQGLHVRGAFETGKDGKLKLVNMSEIKLDEDNVFSARAIPGDGTTDLTITGTLMDARPYIKTILSSPPKTAGAADNANPTQDFTLRAHFDKVTANRGELLNNVTANLRARGGRIAEANIQGTFVNGKQVTATIVPLAKGRQMNLKSTDAGSTLRAANLYSKVSGGQLEFSALIGNEEGSPMRDGNLTVRDFQVRNEATLAEVDKRGKSAQTGPRSDAVSFATLYLPFTTDDQFLRFNGGTVRGPTLCATADGVVRKSDNAIDISGTVVPACGLSRIFNNVPLLGDILNGGNYNEGIFGLTYAMTGTFADPKVQMNPLSVLAPGMFRRLFDFNPKPLGP
ncbi:MAG TPA: DUF3971 domain-containing protein [Aestuariivirga sp.]